jgi:type III restriction enzyme
MKLKFNPNQQFQKEAIEAVVNLFEGQPKDADALVTDIQQKQTDAQQTIGLEIGAVGNNLVLDESVMLQNLQTVQNKNGLPISQELDGLNFSVEMETGTGKTYVYLRTIFELNKNYNFSKFIILVPSIAIKEGVKSSIVSMREHFKELYATPFDATVYSGKSPEEVLSFATSTNVQIMIMTIDSIRGGKKNLIMYQDRDKLNGVRPIDYLSSTRPIIIMDEPQNMESELAQSAIKDLEPTCTLRYSATHKNEYNLVYRLDPIDAHDQGLVKGIVVANASLDGTASKPYFKLIETLRDPWRAKIEVLARTANGVKKQVLTVKPHQDIATLTNNDAYANNWRINTINYDPQSIELASIGEITAGQAIGDDSDQIYKEMIRETIKEHFRRELNLKEQGIKVLSLFFVDKVASYLDYDEGGNELEGKFAQWFDQLYKEERAKKAEYQTLFSHEPHEVRKAYFAQMKKGGKSKLVDSSEGRGNANDSEAYDLIMRNKEQLLDMSEPTRFIFSHSALKEGWDNPNVFQICMMRESNSALDRRQTIGRGLRLPVNQNGDRVHDTQVAQLTVIASESYREFADSLQREYKAAGVNIGFVRKEEFAKIPEIGNTAKGIGFESSTKIWDILHKKGMIDKDGKVLPSFQPTVLGFTLDLPEEYKPYETQIVGIIRDCRLERFVKNARTRIKRQYNKEVLADPAFEDLWQKISKKTTYRVEFSRGNIIEESIAEINKAPHIDPIQVVIDRSEVKLVRGGLHSSSLGQRRTDIGNDYALPNIVKELQEATSLTRDTIIDILIGSDRLEDFLHNPNDFMYMVKQAITSVLSRVLVEGIQYEQISGTVYELRDLRTDGQEEKERFVEQLYEVKNQQKTIVDYVAYDSEVEKDFAQMLDSREDVKLFVKLPEKFKVPTPLGDYNPDWAIVKQVDGQEKVYMIRETKGTQQTSLLRPSEEAKIICGQKHFAAIGVDNYQVSSPDNWNI